MIAILFLLYIVIRFVIDLYNIGKDHNLIARWNDIWTCIGALAVPLALITYLLSIRREDKKRSNLLFDDEIPKFLALYEKTKYLKKIASDNEGLEKFQMMRISAIHRGQAILRQLYSLYYDKNKIHAIKTRNKYKGELENLEVIAPLLVELVELRYDGGELVKNDQRTEKEKKQELFESDSRLQVMVQEFTGNDDTNESENWVDEGGVYEDM